MAKKQTEQEGPDFPLQKDNYILLIIGFAIIMIGFLLMMGGKSDDPNVFNPEISAMSYLFCGIVPNMNCVVSR